MIAVKMTRLSCRRFSGNEVRLWLSILAYNVGSLWRDCRLVKHARSYWLMLTEGHLTRVRFSATLRRIALLPLPANQLTGRNAANPNHGGKRRMDRCQRY